MTGAAAHSGTRRDRGALALALALQILGATGIAWAQPAIGSCPPGPGAYSQNNDVSASVFGSYNARQTSTGKTELCLLVLWRGESGWHAHRAKALEGLAKRGWIDTVRAKADSRGLLQTFSETLGDLELSYDYDWARHRVNVLGRDLELGANNVLLIDRADGVGGPPVLRTLRIEPRIDSLQVGFDYLVKRSPQLRAFLR